MSGSKRSFACALMLSVSVFACVSQIFEARGVGAQTTSATQSAQTSSTDSSSAEPEKITTVTVFGVLRRPVNIVGTNTSACRFMDRNSPGGDGMILEDYFASFYATKEPDHYTSNNMTGGGCGPGVVNFAASRYEIARRDRSLRDAFAAFDANDYPKALKLFEASYNQMGFEQAALMAGKMYLMGEGTPRDTQKAMMWLKRVTDQKFGPNSVMRFNPDDPTHMNGRVDAAMTLAKIYVVGWDVPKDPKTAKHWYEKASEFGYIPATHLLGQIYRGGYGGEKNINKAIGYFKTAGTAGYAPSEYELGQIYYTGDEGVPVNKPLAAAWLVEAAKRGHAGALYAAGRMYDLGETVPEDPQKAIVYYKAAAVKGYPDAENALALFFYTGEIVPKDVDTARKLFEEAAKQGVPDAMFNLAVMYANGEGGSKDMVMAYVWMTLANDSGLEKAADAVAEIGSKLTPEERTKAEGILKPSKG